MSKQDNPELIGSKMRGREKSARPLVAAAALFTAVIALAPQASLADSPTKMVSAFGYRALSEVWQPCQENQAGHSQPSTTMTISAPGPTSPLHARSRSATSTRRCG
jgi:hypothetical protein